MASTIVRVGQGPPVLGHSQHSSSLLSSDVGGVDSWSAVVKSPPGDGKEGDEQQRWTVPLMMLFLLQLSIVVCAFAGITSFLLVSKRKSTDEFVHELLAQRLNDAAGNILLPAIEHIRNVQQLALTIAVEQATLAMLPSTPQVALSLGFAEAHDAWRLMRVVTSLGVDSSSSFAYEIICGNFSASNNSSGRRGKCDVWVEVGCSQQVCYITRNRFSTGIDVSSLSLLDPLDPSAVYNETYAEGSGISGEYYINVIRDMTTTLHWSDVYLWGTPGDAVWQQDIFITAYYCLTFSPLINATDDGGAAAAGGGAGGSDGCERAVALDLNFTYARQTLMSIVSKQTEVVTLVDLTTNTMFASTQPGVPTFDADRQELWSIDKVPVPKLAAAVNMYRACVAANAEGTATTAGTRSCSSLVTLDDGDGNILATQSISMTDVQSFGTLNITGGEMLLVMRVGRDAYYGTANVAMKISIGIVVAVCVVAVVTSVVIFFGITTPVQQLALNFSYASALENEKATLGRTVIREMAELNKAFQVLNNRLATARAFLPHSILLNGGLFPRGCDEGEGGGGAVIAAQMDGRDALQGIDCSSRFGSQEVTPAAFAPDLSAAAAGGGEDEATFPEPAPSPVSQHPMPVVVANTAPTVLGSIAALEGGNVQQTGVGQQHHQPNHTVRNVLLPPATRLIQAPTSSSSLTTTPAPFALSDILHRRFVTVLCVNLMNFAQIMSRSPEVAMRLHAAVLHEILTAVTNHAGVVDHFHGDRFLVTFNASFVCPTPAVRGVEAMVELICRIFAITRKVEVSSASLPPAPGVGEGGFDPLGVRVGASCGGAMCGNLGNRSIQRFSTVGKCVGQAQSLMQHARTEMLSNVVSEELLTQGVLGGRSPMLDGGRNDGGARPPGHEAIGAMLRTQTQAATNPTPPPPPPAPSPAAAADDRQLLYMLVGHGILPKDGSKSTTMSTIIGWRGGGGVGGEAALVRQPAKPQRDRAWPPELSPEGYYVVPHYVPSTARIPVSPDRGDGGAGGGGTSSSACSLSSPNHVLHQQAPLGMKQPQRPQQPSQDDNTSVVSIKAAMVNNEAFRWFVAGSFIKARHLVRSIPAPHDRFLQRALNVVAQHPSSLHE